MSTEIDLDLDALAPPPLRVVLDKREWLLPGGPQSQTVVDIAALFDRFDKLLEGLRDGDEDGKTAEQVKATSDDIRQEFHALFESMDQAPECYVEEDGERELDLPELGDMQMAQLFQLLVRQITGATEPEAGEDGARPPQPKSAAKRKNAPRSRASTRKRKAAAPSAS